MKIVILGAAADMAKPSIEFLAKETVIEQIVLADINLPKVEELAQKYGPKAIAQAVDVNNRDDVRNVIAHAALVMNFVGPYYRFGTKVLEAAVDEGVNYIDICDDYDTTLAALELNGKAKENGVTALIGMGASPGVTNLLSRLAADELEHVQEINTYWVVGEAEPGGFGALIHLFHIIEGQVPTFYDGELQLISSFQKETAKTIDFGEPVGTVELYHVGHPEPITLSKFIPGVRKVTNFGALLPEYQNQLFKTLVDFGFTSEKTISFRNQQVAPIEFLLALLQDKQGDKQSESTRLNRSIGAMRVEVVGVREGKETVYTFTKAGYGSMASSTSVPTGVAALLMARGEIEVKGVIPPECVDPKKLLSALKEMNYFGLTGDFQVVRKSGEETVSGTLTDTDRFPEFS